MLEEVDAIESDVEPEFGAEFDVRRTEEKELEADGHGSGGGSDCETDFDAHRNAPEAQQLEAYASGTVADSDGDSAAAAAMFEPELNSNSQRQTFALASSSSQLPPSGQQQPPEKLCRYAMSESWPALRCVRRFLRRWTVVVTRPIDRNFLLCHYGGEKLTEREWIERFDRLEKAAKSGLPEAVERLAKFEAYSAQINTVEFRNYLQL